MDARGRLAFLLVIAAQALHSIEEYRFRLYDLLAPPRAVSDALGGALGVERATSFALTNSALVLFGLWCYVARVRSGHRSARGFAWFWALLEIANGLGHGGLALAAGGYFPGLATAPLLIAAGLYLAWRLHASRRS
jgi:hypothetical protein